MHLGRYVTHKKRPDVRIPITCNFEIWHGIELRYALQRAIKKACAANNDLSVDDTDWELKDYEV